MVDPSPFLPVPASGGGAPRLPLLLVDADACPARARLAAAKAAARAGASCRLFACSPLEPPPGASITVVPKGADAADDAIAALCGPGDFVLTQDILLAKRAVDSGSVACSPHGRLFDEDSIGSAVADRALLQGLRESGAVSGGPAPYGDRDFKELCKRLDQWSARAKRALGP